VAQPASNNESNNEKTICNFAATIFIRVYLCPSVIDYFSKSCAAR
jgi:hypothetical protein